MAPTVREGRRRVVIEGVTPEIDAGRFPIKRTIDEDVVVEADIFADGHDALRAVLRYRREEDRAWSETPMEPLLNDWPRLAGELLGPMLHVPRHPIALARFGWRAMGPATSVARRWFKDDPAKALFAALSGAACSFLRGKSTSTGTIFLAA